MLRTIHIRTWSGKLTSILLILMLCITIPLGLWQVIRESVPLIIYFITDHIPQPSVMAYMIGRITGSFGSILFMILLPVVLIAPLNCLLASFWRSPPKILILRPFHRRKTSKTLRRLVRRLSGVGHFYTLSDRHIKLRWFAKSPKWLLGLVFFVFQYPIQKQRDIDGLDEKLGNRFGRNVNWYYSRSKIFTIDCTDEFWKSCVVKMLKKADLIFIDLTGLHENVLWEVEECKELRILHKVLFLIENVEQESAQPFFNTEATLLQNSLFEYGSKENPFQKKLLIDKMLSIIATSIGLMYFNAGKGEQALKYFLKSEELLTRIDDKARLGQTYLSFAMCYHWMRDKRAVQYINQAVAVFKEVGAEHEFRVALERQEAIHKKFGNGKKK